jgi:hypothetical protein
MMSKRFIRISGKLLVPSDPCNYMDRATLVARQVALVRHSTCATLPLSLTSLIEYLTGLD